MSTLRLDFNKFLKNSIYILILAKIIFNKLHIIFSKNRRAENLNYFFEIIQFRFLFNVSNFPIKDEAIKLREAL